MRQVLVLACVALATVAVLTLAARLGVAQDDEIVVPPAAPAAPMTTNGPVAQAATVTGASFRLTPLIGHDKDVTAIAFSGDGQYVATGSKDKTVRLWAARTGGQVRVLAAHRKGITAVAFSADGG